MQLSTVLNIFIVKTQLYSVFTNDLKRKYFFRKMFIVTDLVSLCSLVLNCISCRLYYWIKTRWSQKRYLSHGMRINQVMMTLHFFE